MRPAARADGKGAGLTWQPRVFDPGAGDPGPCAPGRGDGLALSPRLKLREFFERWFAPTLLKKSRAATVRKYLDSLAWWEALTDDPELGDVTDGLCQDFCDELAAAKYRRASIPRGGAAQRMRGSAAGGLCHPLAPLSAAKHVNRLAAILARTGPRFHPREPVAQILDHCPLMPRLAADFAPKPPFALEAARAIAAAALTFDKPQLPAWITPPQYWKLVLAAFFYTGLRSGTVLRMQVQHVERSGPQWLLKVPAEIVLKTSKPVTMAIHPQLAAQLRGLPEREPGALLVPSICSYSHLAELHVQLQQRAGLSAQEIQSLHAWRRTHGTQMALLGAERGAEIAAAALDHADVHTTRASYVNEAFLNRLRLRLPELWPRRLF